MFQNLDLFKTAMSMARHAGLKQAVTAQNVANADTPEYRARTVADFKTLVEHRNSGFGLKATRPGHLGMTSTQSTVGAGVGRSVEPNGNGVSLEDQILQSVDAKRQHDRALAIYRASLGLLRSTLTKQ